MLECYSCNALDLHSNIRVRGCGSPTISLIYSRHEVIFMFFPLLLFAFPALMTKPRAFARAGKLHHSTTHLCPQAHGYHWVFPVHKTRYLGEQIWLIRQLLLLIYAAMIYKDET